MAVAKALACLWRGGFSEKKRSLSKGNEGHEGGGEGLERSEYECLQWERNLGGDDSLWK